MARRFRVPLAAAAALLPLAIAACGSSGTGGGNSPSSSPSANSAASTSTIPDAPAAASFSLSETGSTLLYPLFNLWAPDYQSAYPQVKITTAGTGSGTGIAEASTGGVNVGASDAYLSSADVQKTPTLLNIPLAISAQQVNYNLPGFKGTLKLNGKILSEIYQGKITKWNDPAIAAINPGAKLPSMTIVPLHRSDGSGDTFLFTTYLSDQDSSGWGKKIGYNTTVAWPKVPGALGELGNGGMVTGCGKTPGCVAYIGISYLSQTQKAGLGEAAIENGAGQYLQPSAASIQAEAAGFTSKTPANEAISLIDGPAQNAYPIINYEYAIVNSSQPSATAATDVKAFLHWALTKGNAASYLSQVNFQPLPSSVVQLSDAQIAKITG